MRTAKKRFLYAFGLLLLLIVEILIALFVHDGFVRPYVGDVLVVILIYCMVRTVVPERGRRLPAYVFLFACFTEFMQYINIADLLGVGNIPFFRVLIGSVFDWSDILCYGVGCAFLEVHERKRT